MVYENIRFVDDGIPIAPYFTTNDWPDWFARAVGWVLVPIGFFLIFVLILDLVWEPFKKNQKLERLCERVLTEHSLPVYTTGMTTSVEWNAKTLHDLLSKLQDEGEIVTLDEGIDVLRKLAEAQEFSERASP